MNQTELLDEKTMHYINETRKRHAFLTFVVLDDEIIVGIIQNETPKMYMVYNLEKIKSEALQKIFLDFGDEWWWGSSRNIPVDTFIGKRFEPFSPILTGYSKKSVKQIIGPTFNLSELYLKRIKKKKIELLLK